MLRLPALFLFILFLGPLVRGETLLVLPFFNQTAQSSLDWIGESIAENIREALAAEGVLITSREDRQEAHRRLGLKPYALLTKASVLKVADVVDAGQVIFGRFGLDPKASPGSRGSLRITAQILDLRGVRSGPEFVAIGALEDLAALQTHVAWRALQFVLPQTSPSEEEFRKRRPPVRVDAIEYYVRGLVATDDEQKHHFLTQAARLDPGFSPPCFQLGKLQWEKGNYRAADEWFQRVPASDPHSREATFYRGLSLYHLGDYAGAQTAFEIVVNQVPLNEVYNNLGAAQSRRGFPEAITSFHKALEGDSNDPDYHFNLGYALWKKGEFEAAAESFRAALQRDPDNQEATVLLGRCLKRTGPRAGDPKSEGMERLKHDFKESAFLQLRSILEGNRQ
ncbi:MAG: tetratricopeptide repeat protein [Acidobacteria bacterium]|nr:tetratricopeptide repeat protein [Acidobacteriota bacterium]